VENGRGLRVIPSHFEHRAPIGSQFLGSSARKMKKDASQCQAIIGNFELPGAIGLNVGEVVDKTFSATNRNF
jgi:hypothetical protein